MHDIRPFLPQLFSNPSTLLYIGARVDAHSWLDELIAAGNKVVILEVWPENADNLNPYKVHYILIGDVRNIDDIFGSDIFFDYIFWWHGPEHLPMSDIEPILQKLERRCFFTIALACPYGLYPQSAHAGNPFEVHQSTLYPEFFRGLGYEVKTDGLPDEAGSEIVAWKVTG